MSDDAAHIVTGQCGSAAPPPCPVWCVTDHAAVEGEEALVHAGTPVRIAGGVLARRVVSFDPASGLMDGPHVLIGEDTFSPADVAALVATLSDLAGEPATSRRQRPAG